jgi:hypothetical protein
LRAAGSQIYSDLFLMAQVDLHHSSIARLSICLAGRIPCTVPALMTFFFLARSWAVNLLAASSSGKFLT